MNCCKGTKKSAYRRQIFDKNPVHPYLSIIFAPAFTKNPLTVSAFFMQITKGSQKKVVPLQHIGLRDIFRWQGTVILMRIPVVLPKDFNYIDYLE